MKRNKFISLLLLSVVVLFIGCNSPTLPLPPPSEGQIQMSIVGENTIEVSGLQDSVAPYALVTCFNNSTGKGVVGIASGEGTFQLELEAASGDVVEIWQRVANDPPSVVVSVK